MMFFGQLYLNAERDQRIHLIENLSQKMVISSIRGAMKSPFS